MIEVKFLNFFGKKIIFNAINSYHPDIIITSFHPHGTYSYYLKKHFNIPILAILDGSDILKFPLEFKGIHEIYKIFDQYVDHIIMASERMREDSYTYFPVKESKVTIIPNGFNSEIFTYKQLNNKNRAFTILSIGTLKEIKGHDLLLKAMTYLDCSYNLIIKGNGNLHRKYVEYIQKNHLRDRIQIITKLMNENELVELYQRCDLYCQPSRSEGVPAAPLEALGCGIPVIASNVGGLSLIIDENINGFLFEKNNVDELVTKIKEAKEKKWDSFTISRIAHEKFGWNTWAKKINEILIKITK